MLFEGRIEDPLQLSQDPLQLSLFREREGMICHFGYATCQIWWLGLGRLDYKITQNL
jgi:hypothetical protein